MIKDDAKLNSKIFDEDVEQVPSRNGFGEGLVIAADENPNVVGLCADLTESVRMEEFKKKYPERFFEVGVAEQNLVTVGSGLAAVGKIPFTSSYAMFSPGRNWEQIRTTICYNDQPVKIVGSHAGISVGPDGATHQAIEDMGIMRIIPNMVVLCPADSIEAKKATIAAAKNGKPTYIRLSREKVPVVTTEETPFEIGKALVLFDGGSPSTLDGRSGRPDVCLVACGQMVIRALKVAKKLSENKISARVINLHTIKPLDKETLINAAEECGAIVTVEEHQVMGGMGSAVGELVSEHFPVPIKMVGIQDRFGESGETNELLEHFGLTEADIMKAVTAVIRIKNK